MSRRKNDVISKREKAILLEGNPQVGDIITFTRDHPHTSALYPFLHIDVYYLRYGGGDSFTFIRKDHVPCENPSNKPPKPKESE